MTNGETLLRAVDMVRSGESRLAVMRFANLSYDQVCELFERSGRNKFGRVYPPDVCKAALLHLLNEGKHENISTAD